MADKLSGGFPVPPCLQGHRASGENSEKRNETGGVETSVVAQVPQPFSKRSEKDTHPYEYEKDAYGFWECTKNEINHCELI